jgi:putative glutamine transport system permease protein
MTTSEIWAALLAGLGVTLALSLVAMAGALALGTLLGVLRALGQGPALSFAAAYIELFRDLPLLPVLAFAYFGLPRAGLGLESAFASAAAALAAYTAAYVAEAVRSGILAVPPGQTEAGRSLGLSRLAVLGLIILPQAFRAMLPPLGTVFIALVKNTSVASAVAVSELMYQAEFVIGRTFSTWPLLAAFALYLVITVPLALGVNALERRWATGP